MRKWILLMTFFACIESDNSPLRKQTQNDKYPFFICTAFLQCQRGQSSGSNAHQWCAAATQESRHWRTALGAPARLTLRFCPWILFALRATSLRKQPSSVERGAGLQDCSTSEDVLHKGEVKLLDLLPPCWYWKLAPQNLSLHVCLRVS